MSWDWFLTDWSEVDFDAKQEGAAPVAPAKPQKRHSCPKCGIPLGRGGHFHVRSCHGDNLDAQG